VNRHFEKRITSIFSVENQRSKTVAFSRWHSVVGWGTILQAGRSRVRFQIRSLLLSIDLILLAALGPGVDSASNRNAYQESSWM
jgi:hypothetical protein